MPAHASSTPPSPISPTGHTERTPRPWVQPTPTMALGRAQAHRRLRLLIIHASLIHATTITRHPSHYPSLFHLHTGGCFRSCDIKWSPFLRGQGRLEVEDGNRAATPERGTLSWVSQQTRASRVSHATAIARVDASAKGRGRSKSAVCCRTRGVNGSPFDAAADGQQGSGRRHHVSSRR